MSGLANVSLLLGYGGPCRRPFYEKENMKYASFVRNSGMKPDHQHGIFITHNEAGLQKRRIHATGLHVSQLVMVMIAVVIARCSVLNW
jgi:hypothetical protein